MKILRIEFAFPQDDWDYYRQFYPEKGLREILIEGGIGELHQIISNYTEDLETHRDTVFEHEEA